MDNNNFNYLILTIWICLPHIHDVRNICNFVWDWIFTIKGKLKHKGLI